MKGFREITTCCMCTKLLIVWYFQKSEVSQDRSPPPTKPSIYHKIMAVLVLSYVSTQCFLPYSHGITKVSSDFVAKKKTGCRNTQPTWNDQFTQNHTLVLIYHIIIFAVYIFLLTPKTPSSLFKKLCFFSFFLENFFFDNCH